MEKLPVVYMLASQRNGTLYVGVTGNLHRRMWEHRNNAVDSFTAKYAVKLLVWFEVHSDMYAAITREKQLKSWRRAWRLELIEKTNPQWRDLWVDIC